MGACISAAFPQKKVSLADALKAIASAHGGKISAKSLAKFSEGYAKGTNAEAPSTKPAACQKEEFTAEEANACVTAAQAKECFHAVFPQSSGNTHNEFAQVAQRKR